MPLKNNVVVAKALRMELDKKTNDVYLVFKVTDEEFKQRVRENWEADVDLVLIGKDLIKTK